MGLERSPRPPRERTFAELFPWRSVRRAVMLLALIIAIVAAKRSMGPLLGRASQLWGLAPASPARPSGAAGGSPPPPTFGIHLGPTLSPPPAARRSVLGPASPATQPPAPASPPPDQP